MDALLICPSPRKGIATISRHLPLAAVPVMGRSLIEYWLCHLASLSAREILIVAGDRAGDIAAVVEDGRPWGLKATVVAEDHEFSPAEALLKHALIDGPLPNSRVAVLDHFPGLGAYPLFTTYAAWFEAVQEWIPFARTPDRVRIREVSKGVWVDLSSRIAPSAELEGPCWIGRNVVVESACAVGPGAVLEEGSFIERDARVLHSYIGPDTFVGRYTEVINGIAWGSTLADWRTNTVLEVTDNFMLCALRERKLVRQGANWVARLRSLYERKPEPAGTANQLNPAETAR